MTALTPSTAVRAEKSLLNPASGLTFSALTQGDGPLVLCLHGFPDSHFLHQEKPEEVNRVLLDWLARHAGES